MTKEYSRSVIWNSFKVKFHFSIEREAIGPAVINHSPVLVAAEPREECEGGEKAEESYMCSTPSLPSVTSWSTSVTIATAWKSVPASVDLR